MFGDGDPAFMDRFEADAKFIFPATLPSGGTYDGAFAALEFWTTVGELFEDPYPEPEEFLRVEDRVIVFLTWRARSRQTGEEIVLRPVHSQRLNGEGATLMDQKIVSLELFVDTAAFLQADREGRSPDNSARSADKWNWRSPTPRAVGSMWPIRSPVTARSISSWYRGSSRIWRPGSSCPRSTVLFAWWTRFARVISFDKPGTGLSDPIDGPQTLEHRMEDLTAVLCGMPRAPSGRRCSESPRALR